MARAKSRRLQSLAQLSQYLSVAFALLDRRCGGDKDSQRADAAFSHTRVPVADLCRADREVWVECDNNLVRWGL